MAFAVTGFKAFGVEGDQPLSSRAYLQYLVLDITSLAADLDMDIGDYVAGSLGNFWTAADNTAVGLEALKAIRQIGNRASSLVYVGGLVGLDANIVSIAVANKAPNVLFDTGDGPIAITVTICWNLQDGVAPVSYIS